MKAIKADPPRDDRYARAEATCEYYLPWLKCDLCEQDWRALSRVPPTNPSPWHGLVKVEEGFETLVTEGFMEVAKSKKLSEIEFAESGIYV